VQRHVKTLQPASEYVHNALKSAVKIQAQGTSHPLILAARSLKD
jgi:hypothetical protein